ncbi:hypothetical protein, partial [Sphingobacterium daejeonense]|uniref:hypothetical protein n=1 Tax=Sphingobacterium daejeonense TaxID=371142 RepID=UPI003D31B1E5
YMMAFGYNQLQDDSEYNRVLKHARSPLSLLLFLCVMRSSWERLNTYAYLGPSGALHMEPRAADNAAYWPFLFPSPFRLSPSLPFFFFSDYK